MLGLFFFLKKKKKERKKTTDQVLQCSMTGGSSVVRFCGFPLQGSETLAAPTKEDSKNSTWKPQAVVHP